MPPRTRKTKQRQAQLLFLALVVLLLPLCLLWALVLSRGDAEQRELLEEVLAKPAPRIITVPMRATSAPALRPASPPSMPTDTASLEELFEEASEIVEGRGKERPAQVIAWAARLEPALAAYTAELDTSNHCAVFGSLRDRIESSFAVKILLEELVARQFGQPQAARRALHMYTEVVALRRLCSGSIFHWRGFASTLEVMVSTEMLLPEDLRELVRLLAWTSHWKLVDEIRAYEQNSAEEWQTFLTDDFSTTVEKRGLFGGAVAWVETSAIGRPRLNKEIERTFLAWDRLLALSEQPYWEVEEEVYALRNDLWWHFIATETVISQVELELCRIALMLELHWHVNGHYPESLDVLAPLEEPLAVIDPFSGLQYVYHGEANTFSLRTQGRGCPEPSISWTWPTIRTWAGNYPGNG